MVIQDKNLYRLKAYPRGYKDRLKKINKKRERVNTNRYINNVFEDLEDSIHDYELYGNSLYDMYGQLINKYEYEDYLALEDPNWFEYLGRNWSLEDELDYCDRVMYHNNSEQDYSFTDKEIESAVNSWKKGNDKTELDLVQRAMNVYQAVKAWQDAWMKYGTVGAVKLYFNIDNNNNNK